MSFHSLAPGIAHPHTPLPQEEPCAMCEGQDLPLPGAGGQGLSVWLDAKIPDILSIRATFTLSWPSCHYCFQFSALTSPWGGFVGNGSQGHPLTL